MKKLLTMKKIFLIPILIAFTSLTCLSQTDIDGIMMEKNAFCIGPMFGYSSWKNYWEGTLKRENLNLGTLSSQMYKCNGKLWYHQ
jgi:hypothetical protein